MRHGIIAAPNRSVKKNKRVGRGPSSGVGKTCGKGEGGQKKRSGGNVRLGFEGGQMPLYRRLPQRGFSNARFSSRPQLISLARIAEAFEEQETVNRENIEAKGLIHTRKNRKQAMIKIVSPIELKTKLTIDNTSCACSSSVRDAIIKSGGSVTVGNSH